MYVTKKVRLNRLMKNGRCLDVAIDHGVCNEPSFMVGLEDVEAVVRSLVDAGPDAIQMNYGQSDVLQTMPGENRPALVMRVDMGNPYNKERHRAMWAVMQNETDPILPALRMDAACVVVNLFMLPDEPDLFRQCVQNISKLGNDCEKYGMPLMIEPLVMQPNSARGGYLVDGDTKRSPHLSVLPVNWVPTSSRRIRPTIPTISIMWFRRPVVLFSCVAVARPNCAPCLITRQP